MTNSKHEETFIHRGNKFKVPHYTLGEEGSMGSMGLGGVGGIQWHKYERIITSSITKNQTEDNLYKNLYIYIYIYIYMYIYMFVYIYIGESVFKFDQLNQLEKKQGKGFKRIIVLLFFLLLFCRLSIGIEQNLNHLFWKWHLILSPRLAALRELE